MGILTTCLIFPLTIIMQKLFLAATRRKSGDIDANFINESLLFIQSVMLYAYYDINFGRIDPHNPL